MWQTCGNGHLEISYQRRACGLHDSDRTLDGDRTLTCDQVTGQSYRNALVLQITALNAIYYLLGRSCDNCKIGFFTDDPAYQYRSLSDRHLGYY
jgi:hypothetical protein